MSQNILEKIPKTCQNPESVDGPKGIYFPSFVSEEKSDRRKTQTTVDAQQHRGCPIKNAL